MGFKPKWNGVYNKPNNLVDLYENGIKKFADRQLFGTKNSAGIYEWVTYKQVGERIENVRGGLAQLGIGKNDTVGIIAGNRTEWAVCSYATYGLGARFVPMYEKELVATWKYIVADAAVKVLIVSNQQVFEKVKTFSNDIKTLRKIIIIEVTGEDSLAKLEEAGKKNPVPVVHPNPNDIAVLIYTSGTTGEPKGVLLSHGNCSSCSQAGWHLFKELDENSLSLSHLPWAHSYGFSAELNNWFQFGGAIAFMGSIETLAEDMQKAKPTYLISVPRVFNKVYTKIFETMRETGGLKLKLFNMALASAKQKRETGKAGFKYKMLDKVVFGKIRHMFGGRLQGALTASAKMNPEVADFFFDLGIPVCDCYGLTETSPAVSMNHPNQYKRGSVGKPLEYNEVVIDKSKTEDGSDQGEIIVYGPNVMKGYHNKPDKTKEIMTLDGGIRTGDQGFIDSEGFLFVTGRFKEEYKLTNGKYVFPAEIEEDMKILPYITSAMVYGDGRPFNIALIVPNLTVFERIAKELNLSMPARDALKNPQLHDLIIKEIQNHLRKRFGGYEIPQKIAFVDEDFTVENGLLTQTFKPKRKAIVEKYKALIDQLYATEK